MSQKYIVIMEQRFVIGIFVVVAVIIAFTTASIMLIAGV